jgi:hypothetical protein
LSGKARAVAPVHNPPELLPVHWNDPKQGIRRRRGSSTIRVVSLSSSLLAVADEDRVSA